MILHQTASLRAVAQTLGAVLAAPPFRITAACMGIGVLAGLISLRTYHPSRDERTVPLPDEGVPLPDYAADELRAATPSEDVARPTLFDDMMLVALVVGLVACAAFIWVNLPRLMADG